MTQSHIKFEPLILPRKTPAEEARQLRDAWANADINASNAVDCLVELIDRLETPDAPKRWDGVFPWVRANSFEGLGAVIHFAESLVFYEDDCSVFDGANSPHDLFHPYHDGVIITITAVDGTEFPRVMRHCVGEYKPGPSQYLMFDEKNGVKIGGILGFPIGHVISGGLDLSECKPLPPGTVTRITINNTLPTTAERYSVEVVEVVEVEKVEESPAPLVVCNPKVSTANVLDSIEAELNRARAKFPGGENNFAACVEEVGELAQALLKRQHEGGKSHEDVWQEAVQVAVTAIRVATEGDASFPAYDPESGYRGKNWNGYKDDTAAANHLDPQEQPATEAVAEGLPLERKLQGGCTLKLKQGDQYRPSFLVANFSYGGSKELDDVGFSPPDVDWLIAELTKWRNGGGA